MMEDFLTDMAEIIGGFLADLVSAVIEATAAVIESLFDW